MVKFGTRLLHTGAEIDPATGASSVPIYQVSTFHQDSLAMPGPYDYARSGNPTRQALEDVMATLEAGEHGFAFASGMAAISSVLCLFSSGDHVVASQDVYGGTYRVLTDLFPRFGIEVEFVDTTSTGAIAGAVKEKTRGLFLESPSNPLMKITDLKAAAEIGRSRGLLTIVDNTFMTPYLQRPLSLGADIVVHSATKFLAGHSDVIAGVAVVNTSVLAKRLKFIQNSFGAILGPQDSWLTMRGLKTLQVRLDKQQSGALVMAQWLAGHSQVEEVFYPGLSSHPQNALHHSQATGGGAVLSFRVASQEVARRVLEKVKIPLVAVSLGGVESIISYPAFMSHAALPPSRRKELGVTPDLIRYSVGLEDAADLIADLEQAFHS